MIAVAGGRIEACAVAVGLSRAIYDGRADVMSAFPSIASIAVAYRCIAVCAC